ncbi:MAG: mobile mystery protein A [Planctomycetota bacterium]|jgi:predicted DNA-binding mobile mystery protein A
MKAKYKKLAQYQLEQTLESFGPIKNVAMPQKGWVRAIRTALGMTGAQLARRVGVNRQRIARIEQDEKGGRVTLNTMQNVAEALDCEFVYGLVPRDSLKQSIRNQAKKLAVKRLARSNQMMRLEQQELSDPEKQQILEELVDEIIHAMPRNLWDE